MVEFGRPVRVSVWCLGMLFQSKSQKAISYQLFGFVGQIKAQGEIGILLADDIVISTGQSTADKADIAFDGERYLVVWTQYYDTNDFYADIHRLKPVVLSVIFYIS